MNNCVYKFMNRYGELIYIGKTKDNCMTFTIQELEEAKKIKFYEIKEKTKIIANRVLLQ